MTEEQIEEVMGWLRNGGEFVAEQSPLVVQDILFRPWISVFMSLLAIGVSAIILIMAYKFYKKISQNLDEFDKGMMSLFLLVPCIPLIISSFELFSSVNRALCAYLTPDLYVLLELSKIAGAVL